MRRCFLTHRTFLTAQDKHQLPNQAWQSLQKNAPPSPQTITFSSYFVTAPSYGASHTASATSSCIAEMQPNKMLPLKYVAASRALRSSLTSQSTACPDSAPPTLRNTPARATRPFRSLTMSRPKHHLFARHSNPLYSPLRVFARRCLPPPIFSLGVSLDRRGSTSPYACSSTPPASFYAPSWPAVSPRRAGTTRSGRHRVRPGSGTAACRRSWRGGGCGRRRSW